MVKADVKHNYYADLDLATTASIEDVRKAYRKLALQYHPDRNAGREDECVPKFQAIQMANEVLGDPASKQKYDTDRRKAGLWPTGPTFNPRQAAPGNPYAANSPYPPPPRRTQPGGWQRPPPPGPGAPQGPPPSGADRFSNFPRAAPTARKDPVQDRANLFKAWQNVNNSQDRQQNFNPPPPRPQHQPQPQPQPQPQHAPHQSRPRPPPPPRPDGKMPTEDQIRAGMKYRNVPRFDPDSAEKNQSAWQSFNQAQSNAAPKPGLSRTSSMRTPNRQGFNPNQPGSDEKPSGSHNVHRNRSAEFGRPQPGIRVPPPPAGPPPTSNPSTAPQSPVSPKNQRPFADPMRPYRSRTPNDQVPFSEGNRNRTPYSSFIHEKTDIGDGLRRSHSVRDTTKLGPEDARSPGRARSVSPRGRQRASEGHTNGSTQQKPFIVYSDSEGSDTDMSRTPQDGEGTSPADDQQRPETAPNTRPPFDRPKKTPTPPSRHRPATAPGTHSDADQPSMQQKTQDNMYDHPFSSNPTSEVPSSRDPRSHSTWRARTIWSTAGRWALPSSVSPFLKPTKDAVVKQQKIFHQDTFVTAADPVFIAAREDERNAYLRFQTNLREEYESVPNNLDMEVFLKLASTARNGISCGRPKLDFLLQRLLEAFPIVGTDQSNLADEYFPPYSFTFPRDETLFTPTDAKSRSEEKINTNFSPEGWAGAFMGEPEYFAPPISTARKQPSPNRRTTRTPQEPPRSATMDVPTPSESYEGVSPRPWGSDGRAKEVPPQTGPDGVKFSKEEWEKTFQDASWTWPPPPPRQSSPVKGGATAGIRKQSQGRKGSKAANRSATGPKQPHQAHVINEDDSIHAEGLGSRTQNGAPLDDADAMDIDDTPPANRATNQAQETPAPGTEKEPRLYSVPPSTWRQQHEQKPKQNPRHRKASSATHRGHRASTGDGARLNTSLDDLRNVEPIARTAPGGTGLHDFGDMSSTLPFKSEPSQSAPTSTPAPLTFELPPNPKLPPEPSRLSKTSWQQYAKKFGDYCVAFHDFDKSMLRHFEAATQRADARFAHGPGWLEATGDTSGMFGEPSTGFGSYAAETLAMERAREYWGVGCERHVQGVKGFEKVRERVRRLVADGLLPEV